jgi:hypothetical protein
MQIPDTVVAVGRRILGKPLRDGARRFVAVRGFVDVGAGYAVGRDADLCQERQPPRAGRGQDQRRIRYLKRNVIRPLLKS